MKTMQQLESELQAWTPRPPSAQLRDKIFSPPPVAPAWGWNQARVAFASAVALALMIAIHEGSPSFSSTGSNPAMLAVVMSNQNLAAYVVRQEDQQVNSPASKFDSTNLGDSLVPAHFIIPTRKQ